MGLKKPGVRHGFFGWIPQLQNDDFMPLGGEAKGSGGGGVMQIAQNDQHGALGEQGGNFGDAGCEGGGFVRAVVAQPVQPFHDLDA